MRYQAKGNRSLSYLLKQSNPIDHKQLRDNKENANVVNFPSLKQKQFKELYQHKQLAQPRAGKPVRTTTGVSVSAFIRKMSVPQQLKKTYTQLLVDEYFDDISSYMCESAAECRCQDMLLNHEITSSLRSKMVDWMIEVLSSYKMTEETFFKSVHVMDSYLKNNRIPVQVKDLHLIGIASMFIASKYQEIHPLKLDILYDKIARKKFRKAQILQKQSEIIRTLSFRLQNASVYDISRIITQKIKLNLGSKSSKYFESLILFLSKMVLFNSELAGVSFDLLAGGVAYIGLKTLEQVDPKVASEQLFPELCIHLNFSMEDVIDISRKVLDLAKNYSSYFPSLTNLKKFNKFQYQLQ